MCGSIHYQIRTNFSKAGYDAIRGDGAGARCARVAHSAHAMRTRTALPGRMRVLQLLVSHLGRPSRRVRGLYDVLQK